MMITQDINAIYGENASIENNIEILNLKYVVYILINIPRLPAFGFPFSSGHNRNEELTQNIKR
jgi:hypothetical protein